MACVGTDGQTTGAARCTDKNFIVKRTLTAHVGTLMIFVNIINHHTFVCGIDQIEDELIHEKLKIKKISDDVDGTFKQMESGTVSV